MFLLRCEKRSTRKRAYPSKIERRNQPSLITSQSLVVSATSKKATSHPNKIEGELRQTGPGSALRAAKKPLKDAASSVNTIRWKIVETLKATGLPIVYGTGGKTKFHRKQAEAPQNTLLRCRVCEYNPQFNPGFPVRF